MAKNSSNIYFYEYENSPYSRVQTTLNQDVTRTPESPPFVTGGVQVSGGDLFYFEHVASANPVTANKLLALPTTGGTQSAGNNNCSVRDELIKAYVTDAGVPGHGGDISGFWHFHLECREVVVGSGCPFLIKFIYCKIFKRSNLGAMAHLGDSAYASPGVLQAFRTCAWNSTGTLRGTDRIYVEVRARWEEVEEVV